MTVRCTFIPQDISRFELKWSNGATITIVGRSVLLFIHQTDTATGHLDLDEEGKKSEASTFSTSQTVESRECKRKLLPSFEPLT